MMLDDVLFRFAYNRAFSDSLFCFRELSGITRLIKNNRDIERLVRGYLDTVLDGTVTMNDFQNTVDKIETVAKRSYVPELTFPHIHALINATAKYLYLGCYRNPEYAERLSAFHCPMSRKMLDCVWEQLNATDRTALNETEKAQLDFFLLKDTKTFLNQPYNKDTAFLQYKLFQKIVSFLAKREQISPMEYYWIHVQGG